MYFKPTSAKIILGLILGFFISNFLYGSEAEKFGGWLDISSPITFFKEIISFIIVVAIVYILWSLFEKNKTSKRR